MGRNTDVAHTLSLNWSTTYLVHEIPEKSLPGQVVKRVRDLIRRTGAARGVVIVRGAVSQDYVRLHLSKPPSFVRGELGATIQAEFPRVAEPALGQRIWERGCSCGTVALRARRRSSLMSCGAERHRRHHLKCPHDHVGCP